MRAWELGGSGLHLVERAPLRPDAGQVVIDVRAAGLCHSDLTLMTRPAQAHPFPLPLVLGHEIAGVVSAVGRGVGGVREGDSVVVYGPWGCGGCRNCVVGAENLCLYARSSGVLPPGLGSDGGLAEQVLVPSARHVVRTNLPSVQAAPLADAGLTAFAAVRRALVALPPGGTAVVVGVGGLGHVALQVMAELTCTTVIASDPSPAARELALRCGASRAVDPEDMIDTIQEVTRGVGVDVVLDFVATDLTLATSAGALSPGGHLILVGLGPGALPVSIGSVSLGATVATVYWGSRQDLLDVLELSEAGKLSLEVETVGLADVAAAYRRLESGAVTGRLVMVPEGG